MRVSVDHAGNDHFRPVLPCVGGGVDGRAYLFDQSISDEDLAVPEHAVRDRVDLTGSDEDGPRLGSRRTRKDGGAYETRCQQGDRVLHAVPPIKVVSRIGTLREEDEVQPGGGA